MRNAHRITASAIRAASVLALSALVSISAVAATQGSTDLYGPDGFVASFGAPAKGAPASRTAGDYSGSTDTWGANGFRASFGSADSVGQSTNACGSGSTDIWGANGILRSFGPFASETAGDRVQVCQRAPAVLR